MQKYIMISQPMAGLDKETIVNNIIEDRFYYGIFPNELHD